MEDGDTKPQLRQDETCYLSSRNMRVSGEMSLGYIGLFVFLNDDQALLLGLVPADQYNKEALLQISAASGRARLICDFERHNLRCQSLMPKRYRPS